MTTIDPSSPLLAQLRAQALAWRRKATARGAEHVVEERSESAPEAAQDWSAQVAQAVATIHPDDPQRQRKAFRAYLQAVLARECGIHQVDDRGFQDLVDRVQETMESEPTLQRAMLKAGNLLLEMSAA
jgi:hypothetical protein